MQIPYRNVFYVSAIAIALIANSVTNAHAAENPVGIGRFDVPGETALRGDPSGKLHVVVWYPASVGTVTAPVAVGPPGHAYFIEGAAAEGAPLADSPRRLPFVVVSHGTGGTAMDLAWLCVALAAHGYLVASVDHPGNNALETPTIAGTTLWWMRANDLSRVIDGVLATPTFGPRIDTHRIGAAGFSIGGNTVLVLAGARSDTRRLDAYCAQHPATAVCTGAGTPELPDITARARALAASDPAYARAMAANMESHADTRVRAVFAIAPALGPAFVPASLASMTIPVALVAGFADPILPVADNAFADALAIPNAELTIFPKPVGHFSFLTNCTPEGASRFAAICGDSGPARLALHRDTADLAIAFFDRELGSLSVHAVNDTMSPSSR